MDRLRVVPAKPMNDAEIRDSLRRELLGEPTLGECSLRQRTGDESEVVRDPPDVQGSVEWSVEDGVVTLDGAVPSLEHKRLAGVLAWRVPGSRDVVNGLELRPPHGR